MKIKNIILTLAMVLMVSGFAIAAENDSGLGAEDPAMAQGSDQEAGAATQNTGEAQMLKVQSGEHLGEGGEMMMIQEQANNRIKLEVGGQAAESSMQMNQVMEGGVTKLSAQLSNGQNAEIKVMPDAASQTAMERLKLQTCSEEAGCSIELKEVGAGENVKAAYEVKTQRTSRVLGIFKAQMQVQAQVDAESGEILDVKKPWWAFLASEPEE